MLNRGLELPDMLYDTVWVPTRFLGHRAVPTVYCFALYDFRKPVTVHFPYRKKLRWKTLLYTVEQQDASKNDIEKGIGAIEATI